MIKNRTPREILRDAIIGANINDPDVTEALDGIARLEQSSMELRQMVNEKRGEVERLERILLGLPKQITVNVGQERPKDEARPTE